MYDILIVNKIAINSYFTLKMNDSKIAWIQRYTNKNYVYPTKYRNYILSKFQGYEKSAFKTIFYKNIFCTETR